MAMTLRLPEELDRALDTIAEAEHMSKHALILSGLEQLARERIEKAILRADFDRLRREEAEVLKRLEDA